MNTNDKTSGNPRKGDPTRRPTAGVYPAARGSQPPSVEQPARPAADGDLARRWTARAGLLAGMLAVLPSATVAQVCALVAEFFDALRNDGHFAASAVYDAHHEALASAPAADALYDAVCAVLLGMTASRALDLEENAETDGGLNLGMLDAARTNLATVRASLPTPLTDDSTNGDKVDTRRRSVVFAALATLTPDERAVAVPMLGAWLHAVRGHHLMVGGLPTEETRQLASDGHYAATTQIMEHTLELGGSVVFDVLSTAWLHAPAYDADWCIAPKSNVPHLDSEVREVLNNVDIALEDLAWATARFALAEVTP